MRKTDAAPGLLEDLPFAAGKGPELIAAEIRAAFNEGDRGTPCAGSDAVGTDPRRPAF